MGFEIKYSYYDRTEDGEWDKSEVKSFKKKVGDPFEEVSLEKLAASIMAQMARRDIYVFDPELYELTKKKINFKEIKGGITLKNKKFHFDGEDGSIKVEDIIEKITTVTTVETTHPHQQLQPHQLIQPHQQLQEQINIEGQNRRPIDWMVFMPELHDLRETRSFKFTKDKRYPILEKKKGLIGEVYTVLDDTGREQTVSDKYFVPANVNLFADKQLGFSESSQQRDGGKLMWGNVPQEPDMPDLRRK